MTFSATTLSYRLQPGENPVALSLSGGPVGNIGVGTSAVVRAKASFSNGTLDVTETATYKTRSGTSGVLLVSPGGIITAMGSGVDWLDVSYNGVAASVPITVGSCGYSLGPTNQIVSSSGGSVSIQVTTASGCGWTAGGGDSWLTLVNQSGSGTGSITLVATANTSGAPQVAFVTVANLNVAVTQPATACAYTVTPTEISVPAAGGSGSVAVTTSCPMIISSSANWVIPGDLGSSVAYTVMPNLSTTQRTAVLTVGTQLVMVNQTGAPQVVSPAVVGANPGAGTTASQAFAFTFSAPNGWQDLGVLNILVNNFLDGRQACYLAYARSINVLYLVNDAGTALLPGLTVNGSGSLVNSQCTIASPSVSGNGNTLTLSMNMSFGSSFAGNKVFYLAARDSLENNSGWQAVGTWSVPPAATTSPRVTGMTPGRGSGGSGQVSFQFSDSKGWQDLGVVNMLLNNFLDGRYGCYMAYARTINVLYLVNDAGDALLPGLMVNGTGSVGNSQCTITNPTVSGTGNTMTVTMNIAYGAGFAGNRVWYLAARDVLESNSGWQTAGSWTVQ